MTSLATAPGRTLGSPNFGMRAAILLGALLGAGLAIAPTSVRAELQVRGNPQAVRIEARDTPVEEILAALDRAFGMHYQLLANLDKRVSGTYVGPLPRVLTRILDGYNFILKTDNGSIAVTVVGTPNAAAAAPASSGPKVVRQPPAAAPPTEPPAVGEGRARPTASAPTAAPSPAVEVAEGASFPTPAPPTSGSAPAPVPELKQSGAPAPVPELKQSAAAPAPAPPALGSKAPPAPEPGSPAPAQPPAAGPPSAPRPAR
jgi:hypothetical protein